MIVNSMNRPFRKKKKRVNWTPPHSRAQSATQLEINHSFVDLKKKSSILILIPANNFALYQVT